MVRPVEVFRPLRRAGRAQYLIQAARSASSPSRVKPDERGGSDAAIHPAVDGIEEIDALGKRSAVHAADAGTAMVRAGRHIETHERVNATLAEFLDHALVIGEALLWDMGFVNCYRTVAAPLNRSDIMKNTAVQNEALAAAHPTTEQILRSGSSKFRLSCCVCPIPELRTNRLRENRNWPCTQIPDLPILPAQIVAGRLT
jgi:hypothetical protein